MSSLTLAVFKSDCHPCSHLFSHSTGHHQIKPTASPHIGIVTHPRLGTNPATCVLVPQSVSAFLPLATHSTACELSCMLLGHSLSHQVKHSLMFHANLSSLCPLLCHWAVLEPTNYNSHIIALYVCTHLFLSRQKHSWHREVPFLLGKFAACCLVQYMMSW